MGQPPSCGHASWIAGAGVMCRAHRRAGRRFGGTMGVNPVRFAVVVSGGLACLMLGLLAGVSVGSRQTGHVMSVETVTTTARAQQLQQANAAARTVTETVTRTVTADPATATETVTAPPPPGPAGPDHHHHHHGPGHRHGGPGGPGGDG